MIRLKIILMIAAFTFDYCDGLYANCSGSKHPCHDKKCVDDKEFFEGYRCCKTEICGENEGRYCPDPGTVTNGTRLPDVRDEKYAFQPEEWIFYQCLSLGLSHPAQCMRNGHWSREKPNCTLLLMVARDIILEPATTTPRHVQPQSNLMPVLVILLGVTIILILAAIGYRMWRSHKGNTAPKPSVGKPESSYFVNCQPNFLEGAIEMDEFPKFVATLHSTNDQQFLAEFEEIQNYSPIYLTSEASMYSANEAKNRYTNIVAYDHTRVHLKQHLKKRQACDYVHSDYINANYVSGFTDPQAYIACQGPLPSTFNDFWEMVWINNSSIIVMITNLIENGRRKCDQYWPKDGKEQYKHIVVTIKSTEVFANYIVRTFLVKHSRLTKRPNRGPGGERKVLQYHFTQWPDHGTPEYILPVLSFIRRSTTANRSCHSSGSIGPIVIHCSAGVGRTGTYITIQSMIQMLETTGSVNIKAFLKHIRTQRNHLVQTEDQYIFVHDAILQYIRSGVTERSSDEVAGYYQHLLKTGHPASNVDGVTGICKQFADVQRHVGPLDYSISARSVNRSKNRAGALLPVFKSCARLRNHTSAEGSDYINASYLQGYRSSQEFIVTQLPLVATRKDFWQLVWDQNCAAVVTITDIDWNIEEEKYWPICGESLHFASFKVTFSFEEILRKDFLISRTFILEATKDDYVLMVRQYHIQTWNVTHPSSDQAHAVNTIAGFTRKKEGSTVVQDRNGSTAAAQFACWCTIHCRVEAEAKCDVFESALLASQMRPNVFTDPTHLQFLYEAAIIETNRGSGDASANTDHCVDNDDNCDTVTSQLTQVLQLTSVNDSPPYISPSLEDKREEREKLLDDETKPEVT